ncbi:MAG TPA: ABC transporter permease, partial [Steroidobacteraceae bacterium]|nr:ABC transporter permease [Steroidobacteraceae bacterium]
WTLLKLNLLTLPQRWASSAIDVFGIACIVAVFIGLFSIAASFRSLLLASADHGILMVLKTGHDSEEQSDLTAEAAASVAGIATTLDPGAIVSPESARSISVNRISQGDYVDLSVRGVTPAALKIRSGLKVTAGRAIAPGRYELMVGRSSQRQFAGLELGSHLRLADSDWRIVGVFEDGGGAIESELWADLPILQSAFRLGPDVHSVRVKFSGDAAAVRFQTALKAAANVGAYALPESEYYQRMARDLLATVRFFALPLLIIMGIGAIFGALNTMYGAVAARVREIGTARAIGFAAISVGAAVVGESVLLATAGSVIGAGIIYLALNNLPANTNFLGNTQFAFQFVVPVRLLVEAVVGALVIGLLGGLLPAIRAGRMRVSQALSEQ